MRQELKSHLEASCSSFELMIEDLEEQGFSKDYIKGIQDCVDIISHFKEAPNERELEDYYFLLNKVIHGLQKKYKLELL